MTLKRLMMLVIGVVLLGTACSSTTDEITVDDAWVRTSPADGANGAFYLTINGGATDDTLVSISTAACGMAELHETASVDGAMRMQPLPDGIPVPAGTEVKLEPGGMHVMCMNKQVEFDDGDIVEIQLEFATADAITVEAEVRED